MPNTHPEKFKLPIDAPALDFKNHLTADNERILFSGPFGSGKTYFLREYFKLQARSVIHLFPVNYSVSSNQDIFELIKHDILFQLLAKGIDVEKHEFSHAITLHSYLQTNAYQLIKEFVKCIPKIGKTAVEVADTAVKLLEQYDEYHKNAQVDPEEDIKAYLQSFTTVKGSIMEEDGHTLLIQELLQTLKAENNGAETILIIDDLDRIDPEHIFRLLNVFSAHFDFQTKMPNKFGFDKVILVCDINNIRNIYHAKYGAEVDFTGYIDKFYSREVFVFDNAKVVEDSIEKILASMAIEGGYQEYFAPNNIENLFHEIIKYILMGMVRVKAVNMRSITPHFNTIYKLRVYRTPLSSEYDRVQNIELGLVLIFDFIQQIIGDAKGLELALKRCGQNDLSSLPSKNDDKEHSFKLRPIIAILEVHRNGYSNFKSAINDSQVYTFDHPSGFSFSYKVSNYHNMRVGVPVSIKIGHKNGDVTKHKLNYFKFLLEAFTILQEYGMYKD